jgi:hypothetical protein
MILIDLNSADERLIYSQITNSVTYAVAAGVLRSGDLVPSSTVISTETVKTACRKSKYRCPSLSRPPGRRSAGVNSGQEFTGC